MLLLIAICCQVFYNDPYNIYVYISYIVANNIVDHSDVVGALPVGTAPITSSF